MNVLERYQIAGRTAASIATDLEAGIREAAITPGAQLPPVRTLAHALNVSPATVAAAYATLRRRGLVSTDGRRGTRVRRRPPLPARAATTMPEGVRNLAHGNPDPKLLPDLSPHLSAGKLVLYGEEANLPDLLDAARERFSADGIPAGHVGVVGGALDGVERVLAAHLRPGDAVAVEDPGYPPLFDLLSALELRTIPFHLDDEGPLPGSLDAALQDASVVVITPRAQNPTGAVLSPGRAEDLRLVMAGHPDTVLIEDDHAGPVAGGTYRTLVARDRTRWAVVRTVSKSLGPDLRLALITGDDTTVARVEGRQLLGTGWVSHILQRTVLSMWSDPNVEALLEAATDTYARRRRALIDALAVKGIESHGRSGLNVWIPVHEEAPVVAALLESGWAVAAGERYRSSSPPALRVTVSTLEEDEAPALAEALSAALTPRTRTHTA